MQITWYGHSCFLLTADNGYSILTDPCDSETGYELKDITCDAVTVSHEHHDHNCLSIVAGTPLVIRTTGDLSKETEEALRQALESYTRDFLSARKAD